MKFIFSISIVFFSLFANANKLDSLLNELNQKHNDSSLAKLNIDIGTKLKYAYPDSAMSYFSKALAISKKINHTKYIAISIENIASGNYYLGNYEKSIEDLFKAMKLYREIGDSTGVAECYNIIGSSYDYMGMYEISLNYIFTALEIFESIGNKGGVSKCYNNIGACHDNQGNYEVALDYFQKSLTIDTEEGNKNGISSCNNNIGIIYRKLKQYDKSIEAFLTSLKIDKELHDEYSVSLGYNNLGNLNLELGNYNIALDYYLKSLRIKEELGNKNGIAKVLGNISMLYTHMADTLDKNDPLRITYLNNAVEYGLKGIEIAQEISALPTEYVLADQLLLAYKDLGNTDKALYYAELEMEIQELLFDDEKTNALAEMESKYQTEKKQLEIEKLEDQKALQSAELKRKENLIIFSVSGLILFIIFSILLFRLFIQKKKANQKLAFQNEQILQQNEEINAQKEEIETQRDTVIQQKNVIEEIHKSVTDSITYALRIQNAMLPSNELFNEILNEHFIFFRPKDIVSGDFYWTIHINNWKIVTVADCTGHGVPGGFMSMLGISFLNEIVRKKEITQANHVLNHLRKSIIEALQQKGVTGEQDDGMDISLCVINTENNILQFAGANNPLYIVKSEKLKVKSEVVIANDSEESKLDELSTFNFQLNEVKGDNMPISIYSRMDDFTNHEIQLQKGDCLYLFSDGFADQFGGKKGKKFMYKRFKELLFENSQLPFSEQKLIIENTFDKWKGEYEQIDDVTVLGFKV